MLRKIYYWLSPDLRRKARRLVYLPADVLAAVAGQRRKRVPPTGMIFTGRGDFVRTGDEFLNRFIQSAGLKPHHRVLDIGCGIGRMARPLAGFLNEQGAYEGFDIVEEGVRWCSLKYQDHPNFRFRHLPLRNDLYNLSVSQQASRFTFPYQDNSFDLAISISVFTHMQQSEVNQYLQETARVLKPGRRCVSTFFLITPQSDQHLDNSADPFFRYRYQNYYLHDARVKDANIAFKYPVIEDMLRKAGMKIIAFEPGWWASDNKQKHSSFQDILVMEKSS